jgi:hypothetical protein
MPMDTRSLRSLSLSTIALARQFGVRITAEQLEEKIARGQVSSTRELSKTFNEQGIKLQLLKAKFKNVNKSFLLLSHVWHFSEMERLKY